MSPSVYVRLRALAVDLRDRAAALDDQTLPPSLQAVLDRGRDDLAVILAATEPDITGLSERPRSIGGASASLAGARKLVIVDRP